jgi:hypothetical protein
MASTGHWCVALNGEWGSGKTSVLRMLKSTIKRDGGTCVLIDIWQEDYSEDPILPLVRAILKACDEGVELKQRIQDSAGRVAAKGLAWVSQKARLKELAALTSLEASSVKSDSSTWALYEEAREARSSLKRGLEELAGQRSSEDPVVVIVDELDRCRPLYAVALLERIKHFLDIDSISFVLGVNLRQFAHTIEGCYGPKFDGPAYLERFFDRVIELPSEDVALLVTEELDRNYDAPTIPDAGEELQPAVALATACKLLNLTARKSLAATTDFKVTWGPSQDAFNYLAPAVAQAIALSHADRDQFRSVVEMLRSGRRPNVPYKEGKERHIGFHLYVTLALLSDDGNRLLRDAALHPENTRIRQIEEMVGLLNRSLSITVQVMRDGTANHHVRQARAFILQALRYRT